MNEEYYRRQIKGLLLIVASDDRMISKEYITEKLNMILGGGIGFHQTIIRLLDTVEE